MTPLPWSYSALNQFETCPRQYEHVRVLKDVRQEQGEEAKWGDFVHEQFEMYLKSQIDRLPEGMEQYTDYLNHLAGGSGEMHVECKYAINRSLEPCEFFANDAWLRAILDVLHLHNEVARVVDHKTGKRRPNSRQLKLSALIVFAHHPQVKLVKTGFFWLKEMKLDKELFTREDIPSLWAEFLPSLKLYKEAFATGVFQPRPSGLCRGWCPVTACEHWAPKRR